MKKASFINYLGPGILFASTSIGVSHLVQSTRAGAEFGYSLIWVVVVANVLKFPFFEFATRYAAAKKESLIDAFYRESKWLLGFYILLNLVTMFTVTGAVTIVAGGILHGILGVDLSTQWLSLILLIICVVILGFGKYNLLDKLIKVVALVLLITTLTAFVFSFFNPSNAEVIPYWSNEANLVFIISFMGWMPTALDISVWSSLWTEEKSKSIKGKINVRKSIREFNLGYWMTAILALMFLVLGARVMYTGETQFPESAAEFSVFLINIYTRSIGEWSFWIISISSFSVMFGTVIAVLDGYGRSMGRSFELLLPNLSLKRPYFIWLLITALGGFLVLSYFIGSLKSFVSIATILSFLVAPFIAVINFYLVTQKSFPDEFKPSKFMRLLSVIGILFLGLFSIYFVINL